MFEFVQETPVLTLILSFIALCLSFEQHMYYVDQRPVVQGNPPPKKTPEPYIFDWNS